MILLSPLLGLTQSIENVDYISPFNNGYAAVKKGVKWGFIDEKGTLVINYRDDLVLTKTDSATYPIFSNERSLIVNKKNGISYFGYIDKLGKTVIEPQFLNATNFKKNKTIVLKLIKENLGVNDVLMKNVVNYHYFEVVIDSDGEIDQYLTKDPTHITLSKEYLNKPPGITSKFISANLIAIRDNNKKWRIKNIN
ncbi:WG repeat-containing protein [Zunongwangia sp. H14]|uniref:WG repeat-containing protein n=1 Tax=Zunongwangia sp. H14 TaxID=3240792 RepID=UPI003569E822